VALQDHGAKIGRTRLLRSWFDDNSTTILTVAVCAIAVGIVAFGASQIFAARELDDAHFARALQLRDNVEHLESIYADVDADFLRLIANPASRATPWPVSRIERAEQALDALARIRDASQERTEHVEALRTATHEWQRSVAQAVGDVQPQAADLPRDALVAVETSRHRVSVDLRRLDAEQDQSAGAQASRMARRYASERKTKKQKK